MELFVQQLLQKLIYLFSHPCEILNIFRFYTFNESVASKIFGVEGQQVLNVMGLHRGNDFRVVNFYAWDRMIDDLLAPVSVNFLRVGQNVKNRFDFREFGIGLSNRKAKAVFIKRARADIPKLRNILQQNTKRKILRQ